MLPAYSPYMTWLDKACILTDKAGNEHLGKVVNLCKLYKDGEDKPPVDRLYVHIKRSTCLVVPQFVRLAI